jgi:hypothetical protein
VEDVLFGKTAFPADELVDAGPVIPLYSEVGGLFSLHSLVLLPHDCSFDIHYNVGPYFAIIFTDPVFAVIPRLL